MWIVVARCSVVVPSSSSFKNGVCFFQMSFFPFFVLISKMLAALRRTLFETFVSSQKTRRRRRTLKDCCCFDVEQLDTQRRGADVVVVVCGRGRVFPVLWPFKLRPVVASRGPGGVRASARARDARGHDRHRESEADPGTFARVLSPGRREPLRELQRAGGKVHGGVPREKLGQDKRHERLQVVTTTDDDDTLLL